MTITATVQMRQANRKLSGTQFPGTIRSYFPYWDTQIRPYLIMAVEALPADRFDWKPRPEMFTARELIVHIAETERAWIHNVVDGGEYEEWVVPHEDPAQGWKLAVDAPDHASMLAMLETWHKPTQRWLDRPVSELDRICLRQVDGEEWRYTLQWILARGQEHEIHHRA